jgi:hypothetical protein
MQFPKYVAETNEPPMMGNRQHPSLPLHIPYVRAHIGIPNSIHLNQNLRIRRTLHDTLLIIRLHIFQIICCQRGLEIRITITHLLEEIIAVIHILCDFHSVLETYLLALHNPGILLSIVSSGVSSIPGNEAARSLRICKTGWTTD